MTQRSLTGKNDVKWIDEEVIIKETKMAYLVPRSCLTDDEDDDDNVWLPISQLGIYNDGRISVPMWLVELKTK